MKLPKQEFKLMTRIKLIQFWTCFTGIVLTHPRNMYLWSVFWGVMLMYLPMVIGVFEIIMLRMHSFKDYGQLIFHVFVCLLWLAGFGLLSYLWATEENLTTLSHVLFFMNAFLGVLFLLEMAIFIHVVRARINFLKRIDNEIEEREIQEVQEAIDEARSSTALTRDLFVSREIILEKEKQELIQSIKVRLESEMKLRESVEIPSENFRPRRSDMEEMEKVDQIAPNSKQITMDTRDYSEQSPTTSRMLEPRTSKTIESIFIQDPKTKGDENSISISSAVSDSRHSAEDLDKSKPSSHNLSTINKSEKYSTESPKTSMEDSTEPNQKTTVEKSNTPETGGTKSVKYKDVQPNETESIDEDNLEEEDEDKTSKTELENTTEKRTNNG